MSIGINTNRGALSLVKDNGAFQTKFSTIEEARIAAKGNSTNQTLKKGNEAIVKNDDGTFSLHYLTNETDPVKKAAAEKALIDMARKGDTSQFNPKIVEFSLSSVYDGNIKIEKATAKPVTVTPQITNPDPVVTPVQPAVSKTPVVADIATPSTSTPIDNTTYSDGGIKFNLTDPTTKPFSLSLYNPAPIGSSFGLKLDSSFDNSFDFDFMSNYGFDLSNTYGGFNDFNFLDFGSTSSSGSSELQNQANTIVTNPNSSIRNLLPPDTSIKDLSDLPKGLRTLISNEYSDDLGKVNKDLSAAVARFNKGETLSNLDLVLLSKSIKDANVPVLSPQSAKELTDLSSLSDKISENYTTSSIELIDSKNKVAEIASDEASFEIGNSILNKIIKDPSIEPDDKISKIKDIRAILADQNISNKAKIDKLVASPFDIKSLNNIDPKLLENDTSFFSNQIMQIDRVIKGFDTDTDEAALMANAMSFGINDSNVTVEKIKEISDKKIDIIRKNQAEATRTLQTKTGDLSTALTGNQALKDSFISLGSSDIDLKTVDQDILATLRRSAIADIQNKKIKVEPGKLSETVDAMIKNQIKGSIAKLGTQNPVLSTGDTLRLAMLSNQLPAENKTEIDSLKSKGEDLAKRLDYVNKNNIIIANKETMVSENISEIAEENTDYFSVGSFVNSDFGDITEDTQNAINSFDSEDIGTKGIDVPQILSKVDTMITNYNSIINNPSTSPKLKASSILARDSWQNIKNEATSGSKDPEKIKSLVAEAMNNNNKVISSNSLNSSEKAELDHILALTQEITDIKNTIGEGKRRIDVKVTNFELVANNSELNEPFRKIAQETSEAWKAAKVALTNPNLSQGQRDFIVRTAELKEQQYNEIKNLSLLGKRATETDRQETDQKFQALQLKINELQLPDNTTKTDDGIVTFTQKSQDESHAVEGGNRSSAKDQDIEQVTLQVNLGTNVTSQDIIGSQFNDISPDFIVKINQISKDNDDFTTFATQTGLWTETAKLAQKQQEIAVAYEKASPNVKCLLAMLAATSMPELQNSIPALGTASTADTTDVGTTDLSVDAQMRERTEDNIRRSEAAEANVDDTIDSSSANVSNLLRAFREIISKLDMDLSALKNSVSGRTQIDRKFSESMKEARTRWDKLDEAKNEYQQHFQSSSEVQRPNLPPDLQKGFEKLDKSRNEIDKISVKLEDLTNKYNTMIENGQEPSKELIANLNYTASQFSTKLKEIDELSSKLEKLMATTARV